jgi:hypothetical protein
VVVEGRESRDQRRYCEEGQRFQWSFDDPRQRRETALAAGFAQPFGQLGIRVCHQRLLQFKNEAGVPLVKADGAAAAAFALLEVEKAGDQGLFVSHGFRQD